MYLSIAYYTTINYSAIYMPTYYNIFQYMINSLKRIKVNILSHMVPT